MTLSNRYKLLLLILVSTFSNLSPAQIQISSPYSRYGLGELQSNHSVYSSGMGGISFALRNPGYININNPASYTSFDTNSFTLDVGVISNFTQLRTIDETQGFSNHTSLGHVLLGFPITKWCGLSFGLIPFSKTGYRIGMTDSTFENSNITITDTFSGNGGLNQAYIGAAFKLFKNFSAGFNFGYLFGDISKYRSVFIPDDPYSYNIRIKNDIEVGSIYLNYGLQYNKNFKNNYSLVLGTRFNLPINISAKHTQLCERYSGSGNSISIKDTILNIDDEKGKIYMPLTVGGGFTFTKKNVWLVGADFDWQNWKKFKSFGEADSIGNSFIISFGGEYTPQHNAITGYYKKMTYRAGFHYSQSYYEIRGIKINDFAVSIGLGFPIRKTRTTLNLAIEAGKKGTINNDMLQENYIRLVCGISFREFWFFRPKLN